MHIRSLLRPRTAAALALVSFPAGAGAEVLSSRPVVNIEESSPAFDDNYPVENLFDQTDLDYASQGAGEDSFLTFDFGEPQTFDRIVVISRDSPAPGDWIGNFTLTPEGGTPVTVEREGKRGSSGIHALGAPVTAQKLLLEVDTLGPGDPGAFNTGAMEIFFISTPPGAAPVDSTAVLSAATAFNDEYSAANAVDGEVGRSQGPGIKPEYASASLGTEAFVEFDFGAELPIAGFDWFDRPATADRVTAFDLIFSTDAVFGNDGDVVQSYENIDSLMAMGSTFPAPVNARYVRHQVTATAGAENANTGLSEMIFYRSGPPVAIPPFITAAPAPATRFLRESHTFTAAASGTQPLTWQWNRNGAAIPEATSPTLALTELQTSDDAEYTVTVTNSVTSVTSPAVRLTVDATPGDAARGLLVHLPFDETSGLTAGDAAGGDNAGTLQNFDEVINPWQPGISGNAIAFNPFSPDDDDAVTVPDPGTLDFSVNKIFSASCWVNALPDAAQDNGGGIICKGEGGGGEQFCLDLTNGGYRFYIWTGGEPNAVFSLQTAVFPNGEWQHLGIVYNQATGRMKLFINGEEAASGTPPPLLLSSDAEISIGSRPFQGGFTLNFQGLIDDVRLYNRDLSPLDIEAVMAAAAVPPVSGDLPVLSAVQTGGGVEISWPAAVTGWVLEESTALLPASWTTSTGVTNNKLTVAGPAGRKFYRLRRL